MEFGRYNTATSKTRKLLPQEWTDNLVQILNEAYSEQLKARNSFFYTYGEIYDEEFVVIASLMHQDDLTVLPVSVFISHDIIGEEKDFTKALNNLVDLIGVIFDDILAQEKCEYNSNWTENSYKGNKFHYKITRENISLTLQAEAILAKDEPL